MSVNIFELEEVLSMVSRKHAHGLRGMFEVVQLLLEPDHRCLVICKTYEDARHVLQATCMLLDGAMRIDHRPTTTLRLHQSDIRMENGSVLKAFSLESDANRLRGTTFDMEVWL